MNAVTPQTLGGASKSMVDHVDRPGCGLVSLAQGRAASCSFVFSQQVGSPKLVESAVFPSDERSKNMSEPAMAICAEVIAMGCPLVIDDAFLHPLVCCKKRNANPNFGAFIGAPIRDANRQIVGVACVVDAKARVWSEDETLTVLRAAAHIGVNWPNNTTGLRPRNVQVNDNETTPILAKA